MIRADIPGTILFLLLLLPSIAAAVAAADAGGCCTCSSGSCAAAVLAGCGDLLLGIPRSHAAHMLLEECKHTVTAASASPE